MEKSIYLSLAYTRQGLLENGKVQNYQLITLLET